MTIDVIERRRAVEERLRRARNLSHALDQATADITSSSGLTMDDLDPDGSLRTAVTTLAGVAALRPGFDILVSLPNVPFVLRLRHLADDVAIALIRNETNGSDAPPGFPAVPETPAPTGTSPPSGSSTPGSSTAGSSTAGSSTAGSSTPGLPEPRKLSESPDSPEQPENADPEGHVASDLAAMLWGEVGAPP